MTKYRIEERGYDENGKTKAAVYRNGRFIGYKNYAEASQYVKQDGGENDEWVEVYEDGSTSQSTVGIQKSRDKGFVTRLKGLFK